MRVDGRLFHSGLPHLGINALELGQEVIGELQRRFYKDFPAHFEETRYAFATPSTMKPTRLCMSDNSVNQLPPWVEIQVPCLLCPVISPKTFLVPEPHVSPDIPINRATFV